MECPRPMAGCLPRHCPSSTSNPAFYEYIADDGSSSWVLATQVEDQMGSWLLALALAVVGIPRVNYIMEDLCLSLPFKIIKQMEELCLLILCTCHTYPCPLPYSPRLAPAPPPSHIPFPRRQGLTWPTLPPKQLFLGQAHSSLCTDSPVARGEAADSTVPP